MGKTIYTSKGDSVSYNKNTWTYNVNGTTYTSATAAANALSNWVGRGTFSSWTSTSSSSSSSSSTKSSNNNFVDPSVLQDAQVNWYTPEQIDAKWWTGTASNVNTYDKTYWTNSFSLAGGYSSGGSSTTSAVNTGIRSVSSPYTNQWAWNYSYNPTTWYYHKVINSGENQWVSYWEDQNHYGILNTNEKVTPDSTYKRDNNTDLSNPLLNWWLTDTDNINTNIDLVGDKNTNLNKFWDFATAVNNKLQTAYGIQDLNELKQRYPEQYSSLIQSLSSVAWVWNATDPSQRWLLDWQLQAIIWTAVWAWSDTSKLNVLNESLMNKFENWQQVAEDMRNIIKLQTEWKSTGQIAKQMWISEDQVQQAVLAYNWLDNRLWEYYKLKSGEANEITEPYDTKMQRLEQEKKIALDRANREIEWLKQDFDTNLARQKQVNEQNEHNADFMSGQYWFGFSKRGLEWLDYVQEQAQQIIDDMVKNYDRANIEIADWVADILRNWQWNNEDLMKASEDALTAAKNNYTSNMLAIQQQYGTVWMQAQQQLANNVQNFITQAENIYDNALNRQQQNLSNLITNFSNLNALSYNNLQLRNARIQQFQNEAMTMNRSQLQQLANQLWMSPQEYWDLINYQVQAVQNQLNWYAPWAWIQFQDEISTMLESGANAQEVLQRVMSQPEFKAMQTVSNSTWKSAGNGWLYDDNGNTKRIEWYTTSTSSAKAATTDSNGNYQRVKLDETPNEDTWIPNVYGNTVKLAPTVWAMLNEAYNNLLAQWIELKIWDSYRSYETQKQAYESGKAWVVSPDKSYHVLWQAFDLSQSAADWMKDNEAVTQALLDAGFTRPNAKEWWHWSYWEWKDAFWGKPRNTQAYDMARAIRAWTADKPSKNTTAYTDVSLALQDLVNNEFWGEMPTWWEDLIRWSVLKEKDLDSNTAQSITSTFVWLSNTERLMELLEANWFQTWPIMSRLAKLNPRNKWMAEIKAQINTMAAGIARWFGEKWVLSDKDIERYMNTLPHEQLWERAQQAVWDLLRISLYKALANSLENAAKQWKDVHLYIDDYRNAVNYLQSVGAMEWGGRWLQGTIDLSNYWRS